MITTALSTTASPATVHGLLVDIAAWRLWSPHVASVEPDHGTVRAGDVIRTRAFFSPVVTPMYVDRVGEDDGMDWHSDGPGGLVLRYGNRIAPGAGGGAELTWTAGLEGPGADVLEPLTRALSARGQRRRMARLASLAELVEAQQAA